MFNVIAPSATLLERNFRQFVRFSFAREIGGCGSLSVCLTPAAANGSKNCLFAWWGEKGAFVLNLQRMQMENNNSCQCNPHNNLVLHSSTCRLGRYSRRRDKHSAGLEIWQCNCIQMPNLRRGKCCLSVCDGFEPDLMTCLNNCALFSCSFAMPTLFVVNGQTRKSTCCTRP